MKNKEIAGKFTEIAKLLGIKGENSFKIRSYEKAAETLVNLDHDIKDDYLSGNLEEIPGIGKSIAGKIREYLSGGKIRKLEDLRKEVPRGLLEMLKVPGLGPAKIKLIYEKLGVKTMRGLDIAARRGELAALPGMGEKSAANIIRGLEIANRMDGRLLMSTAENMADEFLDVLKKEKSCVEALYCGSMRRGCETIGDIDLLAVSDEPRKIIDKFVQIQGVEKVIAEGSAKASVYTSGDVQIDLRVTGEKSFGAAALYFTGSKEHNIALRKRALGKGFTLNEYGLYEQKTEKYVAGKTEEEIYKALGLEFIPPELRENRGEIEMAARNGLPELVGLKDIKGDLHLHSVYSDGAVQIRGLAARASELGYDWIAVCDHSVSLKIARGLSIKNLMKKKNEIDDLNKTSPVKIFFGAEVDILPDGKLDYPDKILKELDICLGAIHAVFNQSPEVLNRRVLKAMDNPFLDILAHPTARLIGKRPPLALDMEKITDKAAAKKIILEVNAFPDRRDLKEEHIRLAKAKGVMLSLGTDTHSLHHMDNMKYGLMNLRRAGCKKKDVLNTRSLDRLQQIIRSRRNIIHD
ncbi:MAG: DNA polymerase/3'-5' exonuclease PolX [Elusimicrobia bacterium]|nr:DNA polymerase/3'-5' exonuclease PolX [Elusimicrobiota bacterium]